MYGLGANARDEAAIKSIFIAKERPFTDPLIVHIPTKDIGRQFLTLTNEENEIFDKLTDAFWPGPLTIVAKVSSEVPSLITANTGYVGVRSPG